MRAQPHWAEHLRLSHHGAAFIAVEEGVELHPYVDSEGWATAGVGHLITPMHKGVTAADRRRWTFPSAHAAINYFRSHDVRGYEHAVRAVLGRASLTQAQYDMCVSLCFNIGTGDVAHRRGGFAGSSVAREIVRGNLRAAARAFEMWSVPEVLAPRRRREEARFRLAHW